MTEDAELKAMKAITEAMTSLEDSARTRVIEWTAKRFNVAIASRRGPTGGGSLPRGSNIDQGEHEVDDEESVEFVDLFDHAQPSSEAERALVAGYWFQVSRGKGEFQAQEVNNALKNVGHGVGNITVAFNNLQQRTPALVRQVAKGGRTKQARKRYKLTTAGVSAVEVMVGDAGQGG
ncbi:MAG: hypothetical protein ACR2HD_03925 [Solirubrobacteraceae bacterium]